MLIYVSVALYQLTAMLLKITHMNQFDKRCQAALLGGHQDSRGVGAHSNWFDPNREVIHIVVPVQKPSKHTSEKQHCE